MTARGAAVVAASVVGLLAGGCTSSGSPPADSIDTVEPADTSDGPRVLEMAFLGRSDVVDRAALEAPPALRERLELLAAVTAPTRTARLERLEALSDRTDDALLEKTAHHLLEQDDAWLAASIDAEQFETFWSSFGDGVARTTSAAIQGNPIGVLRPLVEGVDGLVRPDELDALDRKQLALTRRWLVSHPEGEGLPDGAAAVRDRSDELREAVFTQELRLFDRLLDEGDLDAAAAHLHVASLRRPHDEAVSERAAALEAATERRASRITAAGQVSPTEIELRLGDAEGFRACRRLAEDVLLGRADASSCSELASAADDEGWGEVAASLRRAAAAWTPADPWVSVRYAEAELSAARRRFLLTGAREDHDPTTRYRDAAVPGGFRVTDVFVPLFWVPATLARSLSLGIGRPIDDRPVVDALAALAWSSPDPDVRVRALRELVDRYADRGEDERAYTAARAVPLEDDELADLEDDASDEAFRRADGIESDGIRRASLELVARRFESASGGESARERLAELELTAAKRAPVFPATALAPLADRLGVASQLVDGRRANGEIEPPGFRLFEDRLTWEVELNGERRTFERPLDDDLARELAPIVEEWRWRRRVAATTTFREAHEGVPVEFHAGAGFEGISFLPRLLPEVYRGRDRRFFTP